MIVPFIRPFYLTSLFSFLEAKERALHLKPWTLYRYVINNALEIRRNRKLQAPSPLIFLKKHKASALGMKLVFGLEVLARLCQTESVTARTFVKQELTIRCPDGSIAGLSAWRLRLKWPSQAPWHIQPCWKRQKRYGRCSNRFQALHWGPWILRGPLKKICPISYPARPDWYKPAIDETPFFCYL